MKTIEFAAALNWNEKKNLGARLGALGFLATCSRCCGSGRYSWCQMYGDTCFKCQGRGKTLPNLTENLLAKVQAKVAAGELDVYLSA